MILDTAFGIHPQALQLRARRSEVLSANLANADTPNYKARDFDFRTVLLKENLEPLLPMTITAGQHIAPEIDTGLVPAEQMLYREPLHPALDNNSVDTDLEYSHFSSNTLEYQTSLKFLDSKIKGILLAIRGQ